MRQAHLLCMPDALVLDSNCFPVISSYKRQSESTESSSIDSKEEARQLWVDNVEKRLDEAI